MSSPHGQPSVPSPWTPAAIAGAVMLIVLWGGSFLFSVVWPEVPARHCLFGQDVLRPDRTVCELAFGGLWSSLAVGLAAGALATVLGLALAVAARGLGGRFERWTMRFSDAFFSLPDVLVLMVIQFAGQTLGDLNPAVRLGPVALMIVSLAIVGWSGPARMLRNRLFTLEQQEFITAARALGGGRVHLMATHLWPGLRAYTLALFLALFFAITGSSRTQARYAEHGSTSA